MPDTLISTEALPPPKRCAKKRPDAPSFVPPTALVDHILQAIQPAIDDKGNFHSTPAAVKALSPIFGDYTVADAVYTPGLLRVAIGSMTEITEDNKDCPRFNALCCVANLLEDFACLASASTPLCTSARAFLLEMSAEDADGWEIHHQEAAAHAALRDTKSLRTGHFSPQTFGGASAWSVLPDWLPTHRKPGAARWISRPRWLSSVTGPM